MSYRFHVHRTRPDYRLVTADGAPFPSMGEEADWRLTIVRKRADTNPDVARLVDETGHCLFRIGLRLEEMDQGHGSPRSRLWLRGVGKGCGAPGDARSRLSKYRFDEARTLRATVFRQRPVRWPC